MSKKKVQKRVKIKLKTLKGKSWRDPRGKKGTGEIHPWYPSESSKLPHLTVKKETKQTRKTEEDRCDICGEPAEISSEGGSYCRRCAKRYAK